MSWPTDLSPTTLFGRPDATVMLAWMTRGGGGVPGVVRGGGYLGGLYRVLYRVLPSRHISGISQYISVILRLIGSYGRLTEIKPSLDQS